MTDIVDGRRGSKYYFPNKKLKCFMDSKHNDVLMLSSQNHQGGYVVVHKVQIEQFNHILSTILWARKAPKINDKWEALGCPCEHLSVIRSLTIHLETMEVYTLWWNGGTFQKMLRYNMKYLFVMDNQMLL
jgi:hypothetical protein